jgi:hypothetical protein
VHGVRECQQAMARLIKATCLDHVRG